MEVAFAGCLRRVDTSLLGVAPFPVASRPQPNVNVRLLAANEGILTETKSGRVQVYQRSFAAGRGDESSVSINPVGFI